MSFDPTYNPYSLVGKTILITGASSGIGRATAIECSKLGATCVLTARNEERLQEAMNQLAGEGHQYIIADLSTQEGIDTLAEHAPILDGVVNNAGTGRIKPLAFIKQDDLDFVFQTNAFAPILVIKALLKKKKIARGASLVFTSSVAAFCSNLGNSIYGASKAALTAYMRYCAQELADKQIRANTVHPGMVETKLIHGGSISEEELQKDMLRYPLKRFGKPEEVAHMMIYLLSDASAWVTGQSFVIDGGFTLK
ncbi:MAG: SDR family oxidoreductase [Paludibacteraceae bacterium]|nr:SDR family oxidoreductase [Paludibacteraceae bacterium]